MSNQAPESCTILTASHGDKVLFGNNEDWINPNTYYSCQIVTNSAI